MHNQPISEILANDTETIIKPAKDCEHTHETYTRYGLPLKGSPELVAAF